MRPLRVVALALLLGAVASFALGVSTGDVNLALFIIFPVIYGTGFWGLLGILLLFGAFIAFAASSVVLPRSEGDYAFREPWNQEREAQWDVGRQSGYGARDVREEEAEERAADRERREERGSRFKGGGVIMLGPIPIVFGSDPKTTVILIVLAIVLILVAGVVFGGWMG